MTAPKVVYLEWSDAIGRPAWMTTADAREWAKNADWLIRQVGWVIAETPEYIAFAEGWKVEDDYSDEQFHGLHRIPKTWIRKRVDLTRYLKERLG